MLNYENITVLFNADTRQWEIWKPIAGYENYWISTTGTIVNSDTGSLLKQSYRNNDNEYNSSVRKVWLYKNGKSKSHKVHRLVAQAFLADFNPEYDIHHLDGNPSNNNVENLVCLPHDEHIAKYHSKQVNV